MDASRGRFGGVAADDPPCGNRAGRAMSGWRIQSLFWMAGLAAVIASLCDLIMLSVVIMPPDELGAAPNLLLGVSGIFGSAAIPVYVMGYWAVARSLDPMYSRLRRTIEVSGVIIAVVGGIIHATTAVFIYQEQSSGGVWAVEDALRSGPFLPALWTLAMAASLFATGAIILSLFSGRWSLPRVVAVFNPVVVTALVIGGAVAGGSERVAEFLVPAAPNVAHMVFFMVGAVGAGRLG
jgi:hypothetical protein